MQSLNCFRWKILAIPYWMSIKFGILTQQVMEFFVLLSTIGLVSNFDIQVSLVDNCHSLSVHISGFPNNVKTQNEKDNYVKVVNDKYGCNLQTNEIVFNESMRNVAKLLSNRYVRVYAVCGTTN